MKITHGDVIELIPGHHLFQFVTLAAKKNSSSPSKKKRMNPKEGSEVRKGDVQSVKRKRQVSDDEALARNLQVLFSN